MIKKKQYERAQKEVLKKFRMKMNKNVQYQ